MTTANPAPKKNKTKEAWELRDLMEELGFASPDAMRAALAAPAEAPETTGSPTATVSIDLERPEDPLAWITADVPYLGIVSGISTFLLRQQNNKIQPPITRIAVSSERQAPWAACPFVIGDRDNHIHDQNIKVLKSNWHHLRIRRDLAEMLWADERYRKPTHVVMGGKQFQGWDRPGKVARGVKTALTEFVPLRELIRYLLQKGGETFMDHNCVPAGFDFDPRVPNPYRNKIGTIKVEMKPIGH